MPRWLKPLLWLALAGGIAGLAVLWSGVINVGASTGHWEITNWVLHTAMRRSVKTHSLGTEIPPLENPALARRAAGHYDLACAPCHGAPGRSRSAVAQGMTPQPPFLPLRVTHWETEELFWIVRHGVKFTGMPAWPALQREDEVWAMVSLLERLPELDREGYRALVSGNHEPGQAPEPLARCVTCHGREGQGDAAFPRLAGQNPRYLEATLSAYAEGLRFSGIMEAATSDLTAEELRSLAEHYAGQTPAPAEGAATDATAIEAGHHLASRGDPLRGIPACAACHGLEEGARFPAYPTLSGQEAWFLADQLRLFADGARGGSAYAHIMRGVAERLEPRQIEAVAAYYASLPPPEKR